MEIADIFVVNKADREGADRTAHSVAANLALQTFAADDWRPPILKTEATTGTGVAELWAAIGRFRDHAAARGLTRQRARQAHRLRDLLTHLFLDRVDRALPAGEFDRLVDAIAARELDPYTAAESIMARASGAAERRGAAPHQP